MATNINEKSVNLISFVAESFTHAIKNVLIELGNSVNLVEGRQWQSSVSDLDFGASVLLLNDNNLVQKQSVDSVVSRLKMGSYLTIYSYPISKIINTIISESTESCVWPCQTQEFEYRLERFLSKKKYNYSRHATHK